MSLSHHCFLPSTPVDKPSPKWSGRWVSDDFGSTVIVLMAVMMTQLNPPRLGMPRACHQQQVTTESSLGFAHAWLMLHH